MEEGDIFYIVKQSHNQHVIEAVRERPPESPQSGILWDKTNSLNELCAGRTACRVTVCQRDADCLWRVHKQGVWQVYGSPFDLTAPLVPRMTYPLVNFNLVDCVSDAVYGEVEIAVHDGALLCIELFEVMEGTCLAPSTDWKSPFKSPGWSLFEPVRPLAKRLLFQGSITFDTLNRLYSSKRQRELQVSMVGPGGRGNAQVVVSKGRRLFDFLLNRNPTTLTLRLVNISIPVT